MASSDPEGFARRTEGALTALVRSDLAHVPLARFFAEGTPLAGASGRGAVQVLELGAGLTVVARDYRRGGALRALLPDRFLDHARVFREVQVLARLRAEGVPCVEPIAGLAELAGPLARLRLCTRLVAGARTLPAFVVERPDLRRAAVRAAGAVVASAFAHGLRHADLHPDNLLARARGHDVEVLLVDLDRARVLPALAPRDRDAMLLRFARYLERHERRLGARVTRADVLRFFAAMGQDSAARRATLQRLGPAFARSLARHQLSWWR